MDLRDDDYRADPPHLATQHGCRLVFPLQLFKRRPSPHGLPITRLFLKQRITKQEIPFFSTGLTGAASLCLSHSVAMPIYIRFKC